MWVFTRNGFYSAVADSTDDSYIIVRGRCKQDLDRLAKAINLSNTKVTHTPLADYPYRLRTPDIAWSLYLSREAKAIDYTNFKNAVNDNTRHNAYLDVWTAMRRWQKTMEGGPGKTAKCGGSE